MKVGIPTKDTTREAGERRVRVSSCTVLATLGSNGVTVAVAVGLAFAVIVYLFLGLFTRVPRLLTALAGLVAAVAIAVGVWAVLRPTPGVAGPPMTGASPLSTPAGSALPSAAPSSTPSPPPSPGPSPQPCASAGAGAPGLTEVVKNLAYQSPCLTAPAGQAFSIDFENQDAGTPHNIHVFSADPATVPSAESLFMGDLVTGPGSATYQVPALPAGQYAFRCDVHPTTMKGVLVVGP